MLGLRRAARDPQQHGSLVLSTGDNLGAVCAFEKGTATSLELLAHCQHSAATQIGCEIRWWQRHVVSEKNVADHMSRAADRKELRGGEARCGLRGAELSALGLWKERPPAEPPPRLLPAAAAAASATQHVAPPPGLPPSPPAILPSPSSCPSARPRTRRRYVLELFVGCMRTTGALLEMGCHACVPIELEHGAWHDLTDKRVQNVILRWPLHVEVWLVHMGTPCTRWSRARTTGKREPKGGMECVFFAARLVRVCARLGVFFSIENPASYELFEWPTLARALRKAKDISVPFARRRYGTPYRKKTLIVTNLPTLSRLEAPCCCRRHAEILQGRIRLPSGRWSWRTALASAYPPRLCRAYAAAAAPMAPPGACSAGASQGTERCWERELAAAVGAPEPAARLAPACPARYRLPWAGSTKQWGGRDITAQ